MRRSRCFGSGRWMSAQAEIGSDPPAGKRGRKKLLLPLVAVLAVVAGAGAWFSGLAQHIPGLATHAADAPASVDHAPAKVAAAPPVFLDLPDIITNLDAGPRHTGFLKLHARVELAKADDQAAATAAMPRLLDLFQTYLREMRPDELRGSAGTYRLREELIARANVALAPARVTNVLFTEMLVQ